VSWGWQEDRPDRFDKPVRSFVDENEWQGTRDIAAYLSVPAAIQFQAEHGWPQVRQDCHELLREVRRRIEELTGLPRICRDEDLTGAGDLSGRHTWYAQMAAFPLPACDGEAVQRRLYEEYQVEVPVIEWNGGQLVRVSVQGYNTHADLEALLAAFGELLPKASN
jgi:isopenicillin-N epimerase